MKVKRITFEYQIETTMKNYIVLIDTWNGITGECEQRYSFAQANDLDQAWELSYDTFGHQLCGVAEIIETL